MTKILAITIAVEGPSDASVISRIVSDHGLQVHAVHGLRGVSHLNAKLEAFNQAAKFGPWLVVRDLDHKAACAASVVQARLPKPNAGMRYRIAHRSIEAWLLADFEGIAAFFRVPREAVPHDPEGLHNPKATLVTVARRSRLRAMRDDMVPEPETTAQVGPGFVARISEFATSAWNWKRAAERSDSLRRCVRRITEWR